MHARLVALVPVLGLLLAGCSGSGGASEPLPVPTATATTSAASVPPSAQAATPQGAAAFSRFYLDVLEAAQLSGDVTRLQELSEPECVTCNNIIDATRAGRERGERVTGGAYEVITAEALESEPGDAIVDMFYSREAFQVLAKDGASAGGETAVARDFLQMRVVRDGASWRVRGIRFPEVPS